MRNFSGFEEHDDAYMLFNAGIHSESVDSAIDAINDLLTDGVKKLYLAMSSSGGNVTCGFELHNFLKALPLEIETHNIADIDSIANVVFLAGKDRYANHNSRFLMHGVARTFPAGKDGFARLNERTLEEMLTAVRADQERIARTIAKFSSMAFEDVRALIGDTIFTPEQAKERGLVKDVRDFVVPQGRKLIQVHERTA